MIYYLLVRCIALLFCLALLVILLFGTQFGREQLLQYVLVGTHELGGLEITVKGIHAPDLNYWTLQQFTLQRKDQTLLQVNALSINWQWQALANRTLLIHKIHAERLSLDANKQHWIDNLNKPNPPPSETDAQDLTLPIAGISHFQLNQVIVDALILHNNDLSPPINARLKSQNLRIDAQAQGKPKVSLGKLNISLDSGKQQIEAAFENQQLEAKVNLHHFPLRLLHGITQNFDRGWISAQAQLNGPLDAIVARGHIVTDTELLKRPLKARSTFSLVTENGNLLLSLSDINGQWDTLHAQGIGKVDLTQSRVDFDITQASTPIGMLASFGISLPKELELAVQTQHLQIQGPYDNPTFSGKLKGLGKFQEQPFYAVVEGKGDLKQLHIQRSLLVLNNPTSRDNGTDIDNNTQPDSLSLQGNWVYKGTMQLQTSINKLAMKHLTHFGFNLPAHSSAKLSGKIDIGGTLTAPEFQADLQGTSQYRHLLAQFNGHLQGTPQQIRIVHSMARIHSGASDKVAKLSLSGPIDIQTHKMKLDIQVHQLPLTFLQAAYNPLNVPPSLQGSLDANAHIQGDWKQPKVSGRYTLQGQFKQKPFNLTTYGDISFNKFTQLALNVKGRHLPLSLLSLSGHQLPSSLTGNLNLDAQINGSVSKPQISAQANLSGNYQQAKYHFTLNGKYVDNQFNLKQLQLNVGQVKVLKASGTASSQKIDLRVQSQQLPLEKLAALGVRAQGSLTTDLHLFANDHDMQLAGILNYQTALINDPADLNGEAVPIRISSQIKTHNGVITSEIQLAKGADDAKQAQHEMGQITLNIPTKAYHQLLLKTLSGQRAKSIPLDIDAKGHVDLATLQSLVNSNLNHFGGQTSFSLKGSGSLDHPKLDGELNLIKGYFRNVLYGTDLKNIIGQIDFNRLGIRHLDIEGQTPNAGRFQLQGNADWQKGLTLNLQLESKHAYWIQSEDIDAAASGTLHLQGPIKNPQLSGKLNVQPVNLQIASSFDEQIPELKITTDTHTPSSIRMPTVNLNVELDFNQRAFLRGRGLNAELEGKILLQGNTKQPLVRGRVKVIQGQMDLFNKHFTLQNGEASFRNDSVFMDVSGQWVGPSITINAALFGPLNAPQITLTSSPVLPENEIVSNLLFGTSVANVTPLQAIQLASAIQSLRGGQSSIPDPLQMAQKLLNVQLNVGTEQTAQGTGVRVGVGKYLNDRTYVEIDRTPDPLKPWQGKIDIRLRPNLNLETTTGGQSGFGGIELLWKRDY